MKILSYSKKTHFLEIFFILSVFMVFLSLFSFIFLDMGLIYDGSQVLFKIILSEEFHFYEIARRSFHFFSQLPVWLFLNGTDFNSLSLLIKTYSFGLIWIHLFSLLVCYLVLHTHSKIPFFFPLFAFFTGPLVALNVSVSIALSVCSYVWAVVFIIHYSDLSLNKYKALLVFSILPLFQSHELMSYISLFFIGLCFLKYKKAESYFNSRLILIVVLWFLFLFTYHIFDLIYLEESITRKQSRVSILNGFFVLEFLFDGEWNPFVLISLLLKAGLFIELFINKNKNYYFIGLFLLILFCMTLNVSSNYASRIYPPLISLPFGLLFWLFYEERFKIWKPSQSFLIFCFLAFISLSFCRVKFHFEFLDYRKSVSKSLSNCQGKLSYSVYNLYYKKYFSQQSNMTSKSILFPKKQSISALLINDLCPVIRCEKHWSKKQCEKICSSFNGYFPKNFLESDFKLEQRFFNFQPVYEAYSKGISSCSIDE